MGIAARAPGWQGWDGARLWSAPASREVCMVHLHRGRRVGISLVQMVEGSMNSTSMERRHAWRSQAEIPYSSQYYQVARELREGTFEPRGPDRRNPALSSTVQCIRRHHASRILHVVPSRHPSCSPRTLRQPRGKSTGLQPTILTKFAPRRNSSDSSDNSPLQLYESIPFLRHRGPWRRRPQGAPE